MKQQLLIRCSVLLCRQENNLFRVGWGETVLMGESKIKRGKVAMTDCQALLNTNLVNYGQFYCILNVMHFPPACLKSF